jgi:hypothetical protein
VLVELEQLETRGRVASVEQLTVGACLFDRGEVLSLEVLDQHDLLLLDAVQIAGDHRHFFQAGHACRGHTPMAGDHHSGRCDQQRLEDSRGADGLGQLIESRSTQVPARIEWIGAQPMNWPGVERARS